MKYIAAHIYGLIFFSILYCAVGYAQHQLPLLNINTAEQQRSVLIYEKLFVHTDRDIYAPGEDIWYKAYLTDAQLHTLTGNSNNLYIELISAADSIVQQQMIRLNNGTGHGDLKLKYDLKAGNYRIRAYTNWMRNFGDHFIFEKAILLEDRVDNDSTTSLAGNKKLDKTSPKGVDRSARTELQFFPESGSMINGVSGLVGVLAHSTGGNLAVNCAVLSSENDTITRFKCDSLGFGSFNLFPVKGLTYYAVVTSFKNAERYYLPVALSNGLSLKIRQRSAMLQVVINAVEELAGQYDHQTYSITIKHTGSLYFSRSFELTGAESVITIPQNDLPQGVNVVTLSDALGKPYAERLVYIAPRQTARLKLTTSEPIYLQHDTTMVNMKLTNATSEPLIGNFSVSVTDSRSSPIPAENIVSYLELQSEIRGQISNASRYFDTDNPERFKQLDLLLLTQGWRKYKWLLMADTSFNMNYLPENGISLAGRVRTTWRNKGLSGINVSMFANKATGRKLFSARTDSLGGFQMRDIEIYGYQYLNFTAMNSSGTFKGWIMVDSVKKDPLAIKPFSYKITNPTFKKTNDEPWNKSLVANAIKLKAVEVTQTSRYRPYTEVKMITSKEHREYDNLLQYLLYNLDGLEVVEIQPSCRGIGRGDHIPYLKLRYPNYFGGGFSISGRYTDNSPLPDCTVGADFLMLPMSSILKVTIKGQTHNAGGVVAVEAKPGSVERENFFSKTTADINGYYQAREFYNPKQTQPAERLKTIHWAHDVNTNKNGEATISYTNTAIPAKVNIIVQGITSAGTTVFATTTYTVK